MARPRNPNRDKAREIWLQSGKKKPLKEIAAELEESEASIRKWKCQDEWENGNVTSKSNVTKQRKGNVTKPVPKKKKQEKNADRAIAESLAENEALSEKERIFCAHYYSGGQIPGEYVIIDT